MPNANLNMSIFLNMSSVFGPASTLTREPRRGRRHSLITVSKKRRMVVTVMIPTIWVLLASVRASQLVQFYVSDSGNDSGPGSPVNPFLTIARAQTAVRETLVRNPLDSVTIYVSKGNFFLYEQQNQSTSLRFSDVDCGVNDSHVQYVGQGEDTVLSGGRPVRTPWSKGRIYR
jgi:hypothetical protein